jgi:puromycin-sensitive aminopeptidase
MSLVETNPHRLPREVAPRTYHLCLQPFLEDATFAGTEAIECEVLAPCDRIILNAIDLEITSAEISVDGATKIAVEVALDPENERLVLTPPTPLGVGTVTIHLGFRGVLNDQLRGFYRSTYTDEAGTTHVIATTQMEAADARRAFPCFDEPDRKAVFVVTLIVPGEMLAVSNQPIVSDEPTVDQSGWRRVVFSPTMVMSTYLVAFVVGPLVATEPIIVTGVPVRVICSPDKLRFATFGIEAVKHALKFFNDYFDIPYPGDKLDLVGIPDFAFGAMENLGCITCREVDLLIDPAKASFDELERVAVIVCHEVAHMWFGDLVTMGWWEGLWLNESFANLMESLGVDAFRPEWKTWISRGEGRERAMWLDGLHATRPIEAPCGPASDAEGMVDVLTYQKGGGVLRTLEQFLTPEVFRNGVRRYLRAHMYGNTVTKDLWDALGEESGIDVADFMNSWILQGGHPVVWVKDGTLTQEPFSYAPANGRPSAIGANWKVPVLYRNVKENVVQRHLLDEQPYALSSSNVVVNAGGWGCYRVGYGEKELAWLAATFSTLDPLERANLLSDLWALVLAGRSELATLMMVANHLGDDFEPAPFELLVSAFDTLNRVCSDQDRALLQSAVSKLFKKRFEKLGFDPKPGEEERVGIARALFLGALGRIGNDESIRSEVLRRFDAAQAGGAPLDPNLAVTMLGIVADINREGDYERIKKAYENPQTPQEVIRYLRALMFFSDESRARESFHMCLTTVRNQDAPFMVAVLIANRVVGPTVWSLLKENWETVMERFPTLNHDRMLETLPYMCGDPAVSKDVFDFFSTHSIPASQRSLNQALERLGVNTAFGERLRGGGGLASALSRLDG